jgi:hypothetical protein
MVYGRLEPRLKGGGVPRLLGTSQANADGADVLHGSICTRLSVHVDLATASRAVPGGLNSPRADRFEQLRALPGTVWIDGEHIRRVRCPGVESRDLSLELWDYDVPSDEFSWSRLPTFKSPEEAAFYAGQTTSWKRRLKLRSRKRR